MKMILDNVRLVASLSGGTEAEHGSVTIRDGKICEVQRNRWEPEPEQEGRKVMDCGGKTLLPGLIDLHTHITVLGRIGFDQLHSDMGLLSVAAAHAAKYLDYGFTTIRDCGSIHRVANHVRNMQRAGTIQAPDLISCGRALMPTEGPEGSFLTHHLVFADGADEVRKAARTELAEGADFVKIFASGAAANPDGVPEQSIMSEEEIAAAVEAAGRKGRYVAAHCHADGAIRLCAKNGVRTIEHATLMSEETLEKIVKMSGGISLIPTLAVMHVGDGPKKEYWEKRLGPMFRHCVRIMKEAYAAGLKLGFGTDCCAGDYCYENGIEFRFRSEECQMREDDILLQATKYNAEIAGIADRVGTIVTGKNADLILVDGKPDRDIRCMYRKPEHVWKNGRMVR